MQTVPVARPAALWRLVAVVLPTLLLLAMALPAAANAANPWPTESGMIESTWNVARDTFIYDPGVGKTIARKAFVEAPLMGYYESQGFDANFLTWAPEGKIQAGPIPWSGCVEYAHPEPCPSGMITGFDPVDEAIADGLITAIHSGNDFIGMVCGNFTRAGGTSLPPTISGYKYEDVNGNGQRDPEDKGLPGWEMRLLYEGKEVATTTTDSNGHYSFALDADRLPVGEGTYRVEEVQQAGWVASHAPGPVFVGLGAEGHDFGGNDFGNYRPATISGHKFDDSNVNGAWDSGEKGLPEWTMQLSSGEQAETDAEGSFSFKVRPGTYTVGELLKSGWRQTYPGGEGTHTYTLSSGEAVEADFGNVCLGGVSVRLVDDSTGLPASGVEVRLEEVSVPGILANEPSLPRTSTETPAFGELLPGTYRIVAFLPEGVFTTDTADLTFVEGRFAIIKDVTVGECDTAEVPVHLFTQSTPGKVTGGVKIALPGGFGTSGFVFMDGPEEGLHGSLQYNDHATGLDLHASSIQGLRIEGATATVWGFVPVEGVPQRFVLTLVDAGEPGTKDRYELMVLPGYEAGQGETLTGGNVQLHA